MNAPMESARWVYLGGLALAMLILLPAIWAAIV